MLGRLQLAVASRRSPRAHARAAPAAPHPRGRHATSNWLSPDCLVPTSSPSLRSSRSISASLKPSECSTIARSRRAPGGPTSRQVERCSTRVRPGPAAGAAATARSAPRSPPASPSRSPRRSRPRSPSSPPARPLPPTRTRHHLLLLPRAHLPVQQHQPIPLQLALRQSLVLGGRRTHFSHLARRLICLGLLDQRAHHVCLPALAALLAQLLVCARPRRSPATIRVSIACRPLGNSRSTLMSRSPYFASASVRGIGVAVMCSTCGASRSPIDSPPGTAPAPFPSSAARWRTPKRCCSSTTATASARKRTSGSINACVPTISPSSPLASLPRVSSRRRAVVEPVSSAAEHRLGADQPLQGREVLLGERLRRRHQRGLQPVLDRSAASRTAPPPSSRCPPPPSAASASGVRSPAPRRIASTALR